MANKYDAIEKSRTLSGLDLMEFITAWNVQNPDNQTSYRKITNGRRVMDLFSAGLINSVQRDRLLAR